MICKTQHLLIWLCNFLVNATQASQSKSRKSQVPERTEIWGCKFANWPCPQRSPNENLSAGVKENPIPINTEECSGALLGIQKTDFVSS